MPSEQSGLNSSWIYDAEWETTTELENIDSETTGNLILNLDGRYYTYRNVPLSVYEEIINASSAGSFFNSSIKDFYNFY